MAQMKHIVYIGLGSNIEPKEEYLRRAIEMLNERAGFVAKISSFVKTEPMGFVSDNMFVNACIELHTSLEPLHLLDLSQQIERSLGRDKKSHNKQYQDRTIDIDILLYDDLCFDDERLVVPHPMMLDRPFVIEPLKEIINQKAYEKALALLAK